MKKGIFLIICAMLFFGAVLPAQDALAGKDNNLRSQFKEIREKSSWPILGTDFDDIISPFGPRTSWDGGDFYFHRGLDISADEGASIIAVKKGVVYDIDEYYGGGGRTVILRHDFPGEAKFFGRDLKYYYTLYMHMSEFNQEMVDAFNRGEEVKIKKGQEIGKVGSTGNATGPHLHFELKVGSPWALSTQLYYPSSENYTGFDPAVNAMWFYEPLEKSTSLELIRKPKENKAAMLRICTSDDQPIANRVKFKIRNPKKKITIKKSNLNLNKRKGFDASSTEALGEADKSAPYVKVLDSALTSENFCFDVVVPKKFMDEYYTDKYKRIIDVYDIWGRKKRLKF
ncbi:M23 family metallopeptidase [Patescibacteria group bacterium]|nr:M23 family metallopeptidase [Patescibacteria group bacterium]MBU1673560.1 M23 family metallopeptidase [Patescibacteria group bacterium]MBU1963638.1 M23 family metallopeptidase [Patescibacteria group bacterium]